MLSSKRLGFFNKTSFLACRQGMCYNFIRGTRRPRIVPNGICGIDRVRYNLDRASFPHIFRISSHCDGLLQTGKSFFRVPWLISFKDCVDEDGKFSGNGTASSFFGFIPFTQMVIKISDDRIKEPSSSGSDEKSHFKGFVTLDGHFETGFGFARFPDHRIKADITDKSFRGGESSNITNFSDDGSDRDRAKSWDRIKTMIWEIGVEERNNFAVQSSNLREQLEETLSGPFDNERSTSRKSFDRSVLGKTNKVGSEFRSEFMSEGDRERGEFRFTQGNNFIWRRDRGKSDEHFHRDFFTKEVFITRKIGTEKTTEPVFEFCGFLLKRPSDASKFPEFFLSWQILRRRFWSHFGKVESNHVGVKFIGFVNLKMHFLKLLDSIGIDNVGFDFSRSCRVESRSKVFVEVGSGLHTGNDFGSFAENRSGGDDCSFEISDAVRGIRESGIRSDRLAFNISESDVKFCFGDVDTDKKFFHTTPPVDTENNTHLRQRGSSKTLAWLSLPNCAVVPQVAIKAPGRASRGHSPHRGRTTRTMKTWSPTPWPGYSIAQQYAWSTRPGDRHQL